MGRMIELTPYLMIVFLAIVATRACAIFAARRLSSKGPAEAMLATLVITPVLEFTFLQDGVFACYAVLKQSGARGWLGRFAVLHLAAWLVFLVMIIVMVVVGLIRYLSPG
jgi:hypothetical protein